MSTIEAPAIQAPTEVTTADVLHRAADLLEEFGWCQGEWARDERGELAQSTTEVHSLCLWGAITQAGKDLGRHEREDYTHLAIQGRGISWNDEPGRTKSEVVALLRDAAERSTG